MPIVPSASKSPLMSTVRATPPPGAMTHRQAKALGVLEFLSMAICRKGPCDTFVRVTRNLQCVACKVREAPKAAAKLQRDRIKAKEAAAKARAAAAKSKAREVARDLKDSQKAAARAAQAKAREATKRTTASEKAKTTRAANKAAAAGTQEQAQEALQRPGTGAPHLPPWMDAGELAADGLTGAGVLLATAGGGAPWEDADGGECLPW